MTWFMPWSYAYPTKPLYSGFLVTAGGFTVG